jgi:hypothetical protein
MLAAIDSSHTAINFLLSAFGSDDGWFGRRRMHLRFRHQLVWLRRLDLGRRRIGFGLWLLLALGIFPSLFAYVFYIHVLDERFGLVYGRAVLFAVLIDEGLESLIARRRIFKLNLPISFSRFPEASHIVLLC